MKSYTSGKVRAPGAGVPAAEAAMARGVDIPTPKLRHRRKDSGQESRIFCASRQGAVKTEQRNGSHSRQQARTPRKPEPVEVTSPRLYVGNLSFDATESDSFESVQRRRPRPKCGSRELQTQPALERASLLCKCKPWKKRSEP